MRGDWLQIEIFRLQAVESKQMKLKLFNKSELSDFNFTAIGLILHLIESELPAAPIIENICVITLSINHSVQLFWFLWCISYAPNNDND